MMEDKKKRGNATITFSHKAEKERLLLQLNSVQLQNLMKQQTEGSMYKRDCHKVLWAVNFLYNLALNGGIRPQLDLFSNYDPEKDALLEEIETLKRENAQLQLQIKKHNANDLE